MSSTSQEPGPEDFLVQAEYYSGPCFACCSVYFAASGTPMLPLLYLPERSKQHARRLPQASLSQATSIRFTRVSAFFPEVIQAIQSRRATGVMSSQVAFASAL